MTWPLSWLHSHILDVSVLVKVCEILVLLLQVWHIDEGGVEQVFSQDVVLYVIDIILFVQRTATEIIDAVHCRHSNVLDAPDEILKSNQVPIKEERVKLGKTLIFNHRSHRHIPDLSLSFILLVK
jgi:hypothetical protein